MTSLPLENIRILDLSRVLAGPWCTQHLGDLGARVIKVERPHIGDETRHWGPPFLEENSAYYLCTNRNKKSIALDLNSEKDRETLFELIEQADVLVENYKLKTLERYHLDYDSLKERFPRLIYCHITGFGSQGPYKNKAGYDALIQAMSGLMSITGPDSKTPTKVGVAVTDLLSGLYASTAILSALYERERSQKGQYCEVSLFGTQIANLANVLTAYLIDKKVPTPRGNDHPQIVPYGAFQTKDRPLLIAIGNDRQFAEFCESLGVNWHRDERFQNNVQRVHHRTELKMLIEDILTQEPRDEWLQRWREANFPVGPISNFEDLTFDPQVVDREIFTTMDDGVTPCVKNPLQFSRTPIERYRRPPKLAEHQGVSFERWEDD